MIHVFERQKLLQHVTPFRLCEVAVFFQPNHQFFQKGIAGLPGSIFDFHPAGRRNKSLRANRLLGKPQREPQLPETFVDQFETHLSKNREKFRMVYLFY